MHVTIDEGDNNNDPSNKRRRSTIPEANECDIESETFDEPGAIEQECFTCHVKRLLLADEATAPTRRKGWTEWLSDVYSKYHGKRV